MWSRLLVAVVLSTALLPAAALADQARGLRNYLAIMEGTKKAEQLSPEEAREVLEIYNALNKAPSHRSGGGSSRPAYEVEVAHNDELFIINGEKYEAKTYCFNVEEGDQVIFIEGSASGACASAMIIDLRTKDKCELWCE